MKNAHTYRLPHNFRQRLSIRLKTPTRRTHYNREDFCCVSCQVRPYIGRRRDTAPAVCLVRLQTPSAHIRCAHCK